MQVGADNFSVAYGMLDSDFGVKRRTASLDYMI